MTSIEITARLEEAGATLLSLPKDFQCRAAYDVVRSALEVSGRGAPMQPSAPDKEKIERMDEALAWIALIPPDRYVLRRVVGARTLVHPATGRHLYSWRRLGSALGADHLAVRRWHTLGIELIVKGLST